MINTFVDTAGINVIAGKGGDGKVSFRHEKFVPKGGPDGGDGGNGGNVYAEANNNLTTLMDFRTKNTYKAQPGGMGGASKMTGAKGEELTIRVPVGTLIYEQIGDNKKLVCDLKTSGQRFLLARGGRGGRGNVRFKSSVNTTPYESTNGTPGENKKVFLEVKLIADVGLVGLPNAGKSTLINRLTGANAKVANYPFTTLRPNLGVYAMRSGKNAIVADIPGLVEGASEGKGLGDDFLRHIERTRMIVHLIDPFVLDSESDVNLVENAVSAYQTVREELENYGANLIDKVEIVVINKTDITEVAQAFKEISREFKKRLKCQVFGISAVTGEGIDELKSELDLVLNEIFVAEEKEPEVEAVKLYGVDNLPNRRIVF